MMSGRLACVALFLLALGSCALGRAVALPTTGRAVLLSSREGVPVLEPVPDALVLVQRLNACDRFLLAQPSTTGIDAFLVRTDGTGHFRVPAGTIPDPCSRIVLVAAAFVPGYAFVGGRVARHARGRSPRTCNPPSVALV